MKCLSKIIEYGLYLLVFLLPIQARWIIKAGELNGYWEYGTYGIYGTDILLFTLLVLYFISRSFKVSNDQINPKSQIPNKINSVWWAIAILDLAIFISIFFAADKFLALFYYGRFLLGVGLFWLIASASYNKIKLIWCLLVGLFMQAALAIWQFLTQTTFANKWLGMALHRASDLGTVVVETVGQAGAGERWLRAYGGLDHPNALGGVMAAGILLVVFLMSKKLLHSKFKIQNIIILLWVMLVVFFVALFFSFSRSAWLALIVGLAVIFFSAVIKKDLRLQQGLAEIILVLGIALFILFNQYDNLVSPRLYASGRLENISVSERVGSIEDSWQIIKSNWLFGVGVGNYTLALHDKIDSQRLSYYYQPVHNVFLLIWAEAGVIGLLGLVVLLSYTTFNKLSIFKLSISIALIVLLLFDHWWWSLHFGVLFFWLIVGLVYALDNQ